jgi:hypothetical protein
MSLEEILDAAAGTGRVVKAITVLEKESSFLDSCLSRHIHLHSINVARAFARRTPSDGDV